ncbi:hypothetical protein N658DRAFT_297055 [Parathielavia hyrcaniae]|uniref:Uncharacterized protein n=1 Tax=Parathielavia hyrcaniae TaxID=113614 RepID=A0AAN6PV19_9PEZI|nr:hypothetical protein N658DRAFT_297055 [Parathielavia hyrcaniae]
MALICKAAAAGTRCKASSEPSRASTVGPFNLEVAQAAVGWTRSGQVNGRLAAPPPRRSPNLQVIPSQTGCNPGSLADPCTCKALQPPSCAKRPACSLLGSVGCRRSSSRSIPQVPTVYKPGRT